MPHRIVRRLARRLPNWRAAFVSGALVATMFVSAAAAWMVHDAWTEHQMAIRSAMTEYAKYGARTFGEEMFRRGGTLRFRALGPVLMIPARDATHAMTLDEYAAGARAAFRRSGFHDDAALGFFRYDLGTRRFEATAPAARGAVAAELMRLAQGGPGEGAPPVEGDEPGFAIRTIEGEQLSIGYAPQATAAGEPVAVFGYVVPRRLWFDVLGAQVMRQFPLLPPSLTAEWDYGRDLAQSDTAIAVRVLDEDRREIFRSAHQFDSPVRGEFILRSRPGGFVVRAALHPDLVAHHTTQHEHGERRRLQFALPFLTIFLAAAAIVNLLRDRELVRARRDFVASVSHDLRTPLAQIRMFSETLMLRRERDEEERMRWLAVIGREARRLGDLVENILLFSHIEGARVRLEPERTDLGELVEDIVEAYVPIAEGRGMRILADAPLRIYASVDPRAMRQVVVNLLDNALKYGPEGQTVRVELERAGGRALLSVCDQGPGIPPEDRERMWEAFVRLTEHGGSAGGSGIGLSVVRSLVAQQDGAVWVEDASGGGARFVVAFPLVEGAAGQNRTTTERTESATAPPSAFSLANHQNTTASRAAGE